MQQPLLVRTADVAAEPWKNGGGTTRELLALPRRDGWRLRISVADVERDGPFSAFAGVDRWFAVLEGDGVALEVDGREHRLGVDDPPLAFAGAAATRCRLLGGPTRDLNLMLRGLAGTLARVVPGASWRPPHRAAGLYATRAGTCGTTRIDAGTLCWWHDAPPALAFDGSGCWCGVGLADANDEVRAGDDTRERT